MSSATNRKESSSTPVAAAAVTSEADPANKDSKANDGPLTVYYQQFLQKFPLLQHWKSRRVFLEAQGHFILVLVMAYCINNWPVSYPREQNHNEFLFWVMTIAVMGGSAYTTLQHKPNKRGVQLLSRAQTEEWKGWMQFVFIMYHYYRNRTIYNEIRVLVSAYVWMTGFGHFLYCDKKQDFSIERMVSMWVRINYFPLLLSIFLGVPLELYYVVPLHTVGFFMALFTCKLAKVLRDKVPKLNGDANKANMAAIFISLLVHIVFFETSLYQTVLGFFSQEYVFRFSTDKYSAWLGVVSGFLWSRFQAFIQWCYGEDAETTSDGETAASKPQNPKKIQAMYLQRGGGAALLLIWYFGFGNESDKHIYNPQHPFVFWMPLAGYLMLRNSSKYLTELHSTALEFMGRITLETYVLQFHVFMCQNVQYIPVVIPGSGVNGFALLKLINMIVTGSGFIALAWYARSATVTTQEAITELVTDIRKKYFAGGAAEEVIKTKPTLGIIEDPEEASPLKKTSDKKKEEEEQFSDWDE